MTQRILFIVPYTPNPIRTRPYNLIRALADNGHEVTVLTLVSNESEEADAERLRADGVEVITLPLTRARSWRNSALAVFSREPIQAAYCWQPDLAARLETLLSGDHCFNVVHVEHLRGARYALAAKTILSSTGHRIPVVWDSVDCISHLFRQASSRSASRFGRWVTRLELPRTERYEGWLAWQFDAVITTSETDRSALSSLAPGVREGGPPVHVLPNGVNLDAFRPDPLITRDPATIVLSGKMSYHANVTMADYFVRDVMPLVWRDWPTAKVEIVGKDPTADVWSLAADPRVTVTGEVDDLRPYLTRATLAAAPLVYSAGIQNKILEAMACGTPVVTTPNGAAGLAAEVGHHLLVGDGAEGLASAIRRLLTDSQLRLAVGEAGRAFVESNHDWSRIAEQLSNLYETVHESRDIPASEMPG